MGRLSWRSAKRNEKRSVRGWDVKVNEKKGRERGRARPLESGRETIRNEGVGEPGRETRHRHPFHPLPIRHHPVMELQIRRHYMPLGNLWFRAQFHASTRPVTSLQPPLIPLTTLSPSLSLLLSLFLAFRHSNRSTLPSILSACSIHAEHKSQGLELILLTLAWTRAVKRKEEERPRCSSPPFRCGDGRATFLRSGNARWSSGTLGVRARRESEELGRG